MDCAGRGTIWKIIPEKRVEQKWNWSLLLAVGGIGPPIMETEMTKFTIELPATHVVTSRDKHVEIDISKLSAEIIAKLAIHGLTQKVADAAASAKKLAEENGGDPADIAKERMAAVVDQLVKGEWTTRVAGESVDPVVREIRVLFGAMLREQAKDVWKSIKDLEPADKTAKLDELFATQDADLQATLRADAEAEIARRAKQKAKLGKLTLAVKL